LPTTSQPSAGDFLEVYKSLTADGSEVISIHLSAKLSGTVASACAAREMLPDHSHPVVDSQLISAPQAMMVWKPHGWRPPGRAREAILARLRSVYRRLSYYFVVDTLEYLQKGGRIGKAAALLGTALQMNRSSCFKMESLRPKSAFAQEQGHPATANWRVEEDSRPFMSLLGVLHAAAFEEARQLERS